MVDDVIYKDNRIMGCHEKRFHKQKGPCLKRSGWCCKSAK